MESRMRLYDYYAFGVKDEYGQPTLSKESTGKVKMSISFASTAIAENPLYSGTQYTGLTFDKNINPKDIIIYGNEKLKVLYVNPQGRYKQIFLARM